MRVEYFAQMAIGDVKPKGSTEILLASLAEEGLKPEDIDTVIYTHLHNDHAGNADLFPDAVTYVQKAEYDNMLSPYPFQKARMDYFPDTPERLSKVKRLLLVDGDLKLANSLEFYLTSGHSRGGQTIVVPTEKGRYVITGDNPATKYWLFADMDKMPLMDGTVIDITPDHTVPHLTRRFTTDRFAVYDSARKQLALAEKPEPGVALSRRRLCLGGNTYILFGAVFGSCGGLFNTFDAVFARAGIPFDYSVVGIAFTLAGLYLACMLPAVNLPLGKLPTLYCFGRAEPFY